MNDKEQLRYKYKIKRKYFQHSAREVADGAIIDIILAEFAEKDSFFIYYSFGTEADTHALIKKLIEADKRVYLPKIINKEMFAVRFKGDEGKLHQGAYGIMEPEGEIEEEKIDVCIAPLLAVNPKGHRLGYGGGYYDRYFASHKDILKVGLGYFLQYTDEFGAEDLDEPLDLFVSERGIIGFGK